MSRPARRRGDLEYITLGTLGDRTRDLVHISVVALHATRPPGDPATLADTARQILARLRQGGVSGVLIAHFDPRWNPEIGGEQTHG